MHDCDLHFTGEAGEAQRGEGAELELERVFSRQAQCPAYPCHQGLLVLPALQLQEGRRRFTEVVSLTRIKQVAVMQFKAKSTESKPIEQD